MSGTRRDLTDVNGTFGPIEEIHSLQEEPITPIQLGFSDLGGDEVVFLQAQEEIGIRHTVHVVRGNMAPII